MRTEIKRSELLSVITFIQSIKSRTLVSNTINDTIPVNITHSTSVCERESLCVCVWTHNNHMPHSRKQMTPICNHKNAEIKQRDVTVSSRDIKTIQILIAVARVSIVVARVITN